MPSGRSHYSEQIVPRLISRPRIEPLGLRRESAAGYIGVSPSKFDQLVKDGRMPRPRLIDSIKVWDREALSQAFDELPTDSDANPWDAMLANDQA